MKVICIALLSILSVAAFIVEGNASEVVTQDIFDALSQETREILEELGIGDGISESFSEISPEKALNTVFDIFRGSLRDIGKTVASSLALIFLTALVMSFLSGNDSLALMGKSIALMIIMFPIISSTSEIFTQCASALLVTKDFMLVLIPVFAGVVALGGNAAAALSFNTVAFSFAEFTALIFDGAVPVVCTVLIAICVSGTLSPIVRFDGIGRTIAKAVNLFMAFIAGIFVAVLSVRGVIAGAADTVTIRGIRFLVGNIVPVVGSAIGEALNSVAASVGLIKNTVGMIGIAAVLVINLPPLINVIVWKTAMYFLGVSADIAGISEIKGFCENMGSVLSVITGAVCFISFVFVISIAIIITVSRS